MFVLPKLYIDAELYRYNTFTSSLPIHQVHRQLRGRDAVAAPGLRGDSWGSQWQRASRDLPLPPGRSQGYNGGDLQDSQVDNIWKLTMVYQLAMGNYVVYQPCFQTCISVSLARLSW